MNVLMTLTLSLFATVFGGSLLAQEVIQRPVWSPSTVYVYESVDLLKKEITDTYEQTVLSVSGDRARLQSITKKRTGAVTIDLAHLSPIRPSASAVVAAIRFPTSVGDSWKWTVATPMAHDRNVILTWDMTGRFVGWEEVTVPAGTYRAAKIEHSGYWSTNPRDSASLKMVFWYVPEIGRFAKWQEVHYIWNGQIDIHSEFRLIKYQSAPDMSDPFAEGKAQSTQ